ncbi:hypothetical protein Pelo_7917 [Pelomyxa schiedti]|nr:hypothetical protein Pelo_7917 [Pelomyxa schiedti]
MGGDTYEPPPDPFVLTEEQKTELLAATKIAGCHADLLPHRMMPCNHKNPVVIGLDVTGSQQRVYAYILARLPEIVHSIFRTLDDCAISLAFIGDASVDPRAPLQVTPFCTTLEELQSFVLKLSLEQNSALVYPARPGGNNGVESYDLCALHYALRSQLSHKGLFIIVGDELIPDRTEEYSISRVLDLRGETSKIPPQIFKSLKRFYHPIFIHSDYGYPVHSVVHCYYENDTVSRKYYTNVEAQWQSLVGPECVTQANTPHEVLLQIISAVESWSRRKAAGIADVIETPQQSRISKMPESTSSGKSSRVEWIPLVSRAVWIVLKREFSVELSAKRWAHSDSSADESDLVLVSAGEAVFPLRACVGKLLKSLCGVTLYILKCCVIKDAPRLAQWYCDYYGVTKSKDPFYSLINTPKRNSLPYYTLFAILGNADTPSKVELVDWIVKYFQIPLPLLSCTIQKCMKLASSSKSYDLLMAHFSPTLRSEYRKAERQSEFVSLSALTDCLETKTLNGREIEIFTELFDVFPMAEFEKTNYILPETRKHDTADFLEWILPQTKLTEEKAREIIRYMECNRSVELLLPYAHLEASPPTLNTLLENLIKRDQIEFAKNLWISCGSPPVPSSLLNGHDYSLIRQTVEAFPPLVPFMASHARYIAVDLWLHQKPGFRDTLKWLLDQVSIPSDLRYDVMQSLAAYTGSVEGLEWAFNTVGPELRTANVESDNAAMIKAIFHYVMRYSWNHKQEVSVLNWLESKVGKIPQEATTSYLATYIHSAMGGRRLDLLNWIFGRFEVAVKDITDRIQPLLDTCCDICVGTVEGTQWMIDHFPDRDILLKMLVSALGKKVNRVTYELIKSHMSPPPTLEERRSKRCSWDPPYFYYGLSSIPHIKWLVEECAITRGDLVEGKLLTVMDPSYEDYTAVLLKNIAETNPLAAQWFYDKFGIAFPF